MALLRRADDGVDGFLFISVIYTAIVHILCTIVARFTDQYSVAYFAACPESAGPENARPTRTAGDSLLEGLQSITTHRASDRPIDKCLVRTHEVCMASAGTGQIDSHRPTTTATCGPTLSSQIL